MAGLRGDSRYWKDLCEPVPRVHEGVALRKAGASSMMDISDGLALSVHDLMKASETGCRINTALIPAIDGYPDDTRISYALYGGGDFELLFTIPPEKIKGIPGSSTIIGMVVEETDILLDEKPLHDRGYRHQW
jgi:thiamine-monophosphate kinase